METDKKSETMKILEMVKNGELNVQEAALLIEALNGKGEESAQAETGPNEHASGGGFGERFEGISNIIQESIQGVVGAIHSAGQTDDAGNDSLFSKSGDIKGHDYEFRDNRFNVAKIEGLYLEDAAFVDNMINASKFSEVHLEDSKMQNSSVNGAGVSRLLLDKSNWDEVKVNGSKLDGVRLENGCYWKEVTLEGVSFKNIEFENVFLEDVSFQAGSMESVVIKNVKLENQKFSMMKLKDIEIDGNEAFLRAVKSED